jgi:hypothetical protein
VKFPNPIRRLQTAYRRWRVVSDVSASVGTLVQAQNSRINDGAMYDQPLLLPEYVQKALSGQQLAAYIQEAVGDSQSFRFQFDTPQRGAYDQPIQMPTENPLYEWNHATRKMVLENCHAVYERNPLANTAVQYTADFVIGEGFNLTCKSKAVRDFLEGFIDNPDNAIREYERQAVIDLQVDGELFLRFFEQGGEVVAVPLRPWECHSIKTELGFFRRREFYQFQIYEREGDYPGGDQKTELEDIKADEILHVAINRHAYELRGRPELYRILPWLRADKEFLENTARQHHWRNALLWLVRVAQATPAQIAAVVARYSRPPQPGSVAVETSNVDITPLVNSASSSAAAEDGRQIRLKSIMGLRLPEYMFADGYNSNLATATAQSMPAMTKFSAFQTIMIEQLWIPLFRRVLQNAVDAGLLPMEIDEEDSEGDVRYEDDGKTAYRCETVKAFSVSYSPIQTESDLTLVQALALASDKEWVDNDTAIEELGFDPAIVGKRIEKERAKKQAREQEEIKAGLRPPPPGMRAEGMNGDMMGGKGQGKPPVDADEEYEDKKAVA